MSPIWNSLRKETLHDLLFLTCATKFYSNFVAPYVYFAAKSNPGSAFEFIVDDAQNFNLKHQQSLDWLRKNLNVTIVIRCFSSLSIKPRNDNSIRFCVDPITSSDFVYIGDVDIMIFDNILSIHAPIFNRGLPYSNIIRPNTKRLTGLHLCKASSQFPLGNIDDLVKAINNDEELLYAIIERKGMLYPNDKSADLDVGRPVHGIHLSLNRLPFSYGKERPGWELSYETLNVFRNISITEEFKDFFESLYPGSQHILLNLVVLSRGAFSIGPEKFGRLP